MPLTIHTGPANSGKTGVLYDILGRASQTGEPVLVVPTSADVELATLEFARRGWLGVRVVQFDTWFAQVWALNGDGRRLVTDAQRRSILRVSSAASGVSVLDVSRESTIELIASTIRDGFLTRPFQAGVVSEQIEQMFDTYQTVLAQRGLVERDQALVHLESAGLSLAGPCALNRFTVLTDIQERFIALLGRVTRTELALAWEEGSPATAALDSTIDRLVAAGARLESGGRETGWTDRGLVAAVRNLYTGHSVKDAPVLFATASGEDAECAQAARQAAQIAREGVDPADIAVVARDIGPRLQTLASALESHGLPVAFDTTVPLARTALGTAFSILLDASRGMAERPRLVALLEGPYLECGSEQVAGLDADWRRARAESVTMARDASKRVPQFAAGIEAFRTSAGDDAATWGKRVERVASRMLAVAVAGDGDERQRAVDAAAHRTIVQLVDDLVGLGEPATPELLAQMLPSGRVHLRGGSGGGVLLADAQRMRGRRFHTVILMGLTSREFSTHAPTPPHELLRRRLDGRQVTDRAAVERLLFHSVVTRARNTVVLTRQAEDERGAAIRPSALWEDMADVLGGTQAAHAAEPTAVTSMHMGTAAVAERAPAYTTGRRQLRAEAIESMRGPVAVEDSQEPVPRPVQEPVSVTDIETYIQCPRKWFMSRALRPRDLDSTVGAREVGTRAHAILAAFYGHRMESGQGRLTAQGIAAALQHLDEQVVQLDGRGPRAKTLAEELALAKATTWARQAILDDADALEGFEPWGVERAFGSDGSSFHFGGVALRGRIDRLDVSSSGVFVTDYKSSSAVHGIQSMPRYGLIQIPVYAAAASVMTGLPVAGGVYRSLAKPAMRGFWDPEVIQPGPLASARDAMDAHDIAQEIARLETVVSEAKAGMDAGHIAAEPTHSSACTYCVFATRCERCS